MWPLWEGWVKLIHYGYVKKWRVVDPLTHFSRFSDIFRGYRNVTRLKWVKITTKFLTFGGNNSSNYS